MFVQQRLALDYGMSLLHLEKWGLEVSIGECRRKKGQSDSQNRLQVVNRTGE